MIEKTLPYLIVFFAALTATLALTPIVREIHRRWGMVDKPDPRRINKVPIPRGGGVAIVLGVMLTYGLFHLVSGRPWIQGISDASAYKLMTLAIGISLLGLADDKFSLPPKAKLLGQIALAALVWAWAGLGFRLLWPALPAWLDCAMTVFWITGAVNAFNLIDGLDGLASGLSLIAVVGMAGGLFFVQNSQANLFYFALAGGLLGFLRYNWNPASVFLGDSGSMFLGFMVSVLPLASQVPNSFLVSVGMPLLAMGVPIFDTFLAILRRSLRHLLNVGSGRNVDQVMTADSDHLHHRILRMVNRNQRRAAWILYAIALGAVGFGLVAMSLQSRSGGLWLCAFALAIIVMFKDSSIELFEAGRLASQIVHSRKTACRRHVARLATPLYVLADTIVLIGSYFLCCWSVNFDVDMRVLKTTLPLRVVSIFTCLVFFRAYRTVWSRAVTSNFVRLALACFIGTVIGTACVYYWPTLPVSDMRAFSIAFGLLSFMGLAFVRLLRRIGRDLFYAMDCGRLKGRKDVSRILVYGSGLRYQAFRRELVRTSAANTRIIVGILDDDLLIKGHYVGGIRIYGSLGDAPAIINELNVDTVVITCAVDDDWVRIVRQVLKATGVKITRFNFSESPL